MQNVAMRQSIVPRTAPPRRVRLDSLPPQPTHLAPPPRDWKAKRSFERGSRRLSHARNTSHRIILSSPTGFGRRVCIHQSSVPSRDPKIFIPTCCRRSPMSAVSRDRERLDSLRVAFHATLPGRHFRMRSAPADQDVQPSSPCPLGRFSLRASLAIRLSSNRCSCAFKDCAAVVCVHAALVSNAPGHAKIPDRGRGLDIACSPAGLREAIEVLNLNVEAFPQSGTSTTSCRAYSWTAQDWRSDDSPDPSPTNLASHSTVDPLKRYGPKCVAPKVGRRRLRKLCLGASATLPSTRRRTPAYHGNAPDSAEMLHEWRASATGDRNVEILDVGACSTSLATSLFSVRIKDVER